MIYGQASLDKGIGQLTSHKLRNILSKENFWEEAFCILQYKRLLIDNKATKKILISY